MKSQGRTITPWHLRTRALELGGRTLVMGVVICYAALIILLNFIADMVYGVLDPRVRMT